ncbi:hypothetical protein HYALB_00007019 [Hymenoscyphus albidus]|uniref:Uncharacterized protein n=1 Tax=Hymenoscyphus albidus TaxID=595503 RepID=A0A9N9LLI8_9HELO|nr:hypothetical protein HYALB_00007019 [Hymenoscyphus albidus]
MPSKSTRKGSTSSSHRPNLIRASATAPSLATSNASRKDLSSLQSSRATALLTRVASYSLGQYEQRGSRSSSVSSSPDQSPVGMGGRKEPFEMVGSSNYYSFPSFEESQEYHHQERRP